MKIREGLLKTSPETLATLTQTVESDIEKLEAKLKTAKLARAQFEAIRLLRKFDLTFGDMFIFPNGMDTGLRMVLLDEVSETVGLHFSYQYPTGKRVVNVLNEGSLLIFMGNAIKVIE